MAESDIESDSPSVKERWGRLTERGAVLTKEVGTSIANAGRQVGEASKKAANQAKESIAERRKKKLMQKMVKDVEDLLEEDTRDSSDPENVDDMRRRIAELEVRQKEQELLIEEMSGFTEELISGEADNSVQLSADSDDGKKKVGFAATIKQIYSLIGFAVIWALLLMFSSQLADERNWEIEGQPLSNAIWIIGAMIWGFVVISQLSRVGSFEKLPISFRLQATIGIGVATAFSSMLPIMEGMPAMFLVFSWLVTAAVTVLITSSILNGLRSLNG